MGFLRDASMAGEGMAPTRTLEGVYGVLYKVVAACFSGFFLYTTFFGLISQETHVGFYYLGTFVLCFLLYPAGRKSPGKRISVLDGFFIVGMIGTMVYYIVEFPTLSNRIGGATEIQDAAHGLR